MFGMCLEMHLAISIRTLEFDVEMWMDDDLAISSFIEYYSGKEKSGQSVTLLLISDCPFHY